MKALILVTTTLGLLSSRAYAEDPLPVHIGQQNHLGFSLRAGFPQTGENGGSFNVFVPRFDALFAVGDSGGIAVQWPFALLAGEGDSRFVVGNVFVGYAFNPRKDLRFTPGLVLPLAQIPNDNLDDALADAITYAIAASAAAGHELWLYVPEAFSIVAPLHSEQILSDVVKLEADATLAIVFPKNSDTEIILDTEVAVLLSVVRIGLGGVVLLTGERSDRAIISASLGVRVPVGPGRLWADLLVTLDDPALLQDGAIPSLAVGYRTSF